MALKENIKYSYKDIAVVPCKISNVNHREECVPYYKNGKLPIFTAPMSSVVDESNFQIFEENHINAILPRTVNYDIRLSYAINGRWAAFGLQEFIDTFLEKTVKTESLKVLVDIANGHMESLLNAIKAFKEKYKDIPNEIMAGNIANPLTYEAYVDAGTDYVRCSIGSGEGCLTASNTAVFYPQASLINEIVEIKRKLLKDKGNVCTKIIADGGIRNYSDVIKALALGADYVMIGGVFARMFESAGKKFFIKDGDKKSIIDGIDVVQKDKKNNVWEITNTITHKTIETDKLLKTFYGMASGKAQTILNGKKIHTSEGLEKTVEINCNISSWVENLTDYLRSAMSYTGNKTISDFIANTDTVVMSANASLSFNK